MSANPGNRSGLIRQYVTDTFGEPPYTQEEALQFSRVAMSEGVSAGEVAEALDVDEGVVAGFYEQAANPIDVIDAQAQAAAANITPGDYAGMSESEIAQMMGYRGGGQTRRFMTPVGMVQMASGGIADLPPNLPMTQAMPEETIMMESETVMEEPMPDTDYPELVDMTIEAIRGNVENPDPISISL